jgi:hypothetical protein
MYVSYLIPSESYSRLEPSCNYVQKVKTAYERTLTSPFLKTRSSMSSSPTVIPGLCLSWLKNSNKTINVQPRVETDSMIIVENHMTQQRNEKKQLAPAVAQISSLPDNFGVIDILSADAGYFRIM